MSAQGSMNAITGAITSGVLAAAKIGEGVDKAMANKAKGILKQKLTTRKAIKNQASQRMGKVGGNK